jgi:hypothetical protein
MIKKVPGRELSSHRKVVKVEMSKHESTNQDSNDTTHGGNLSKHITQNAEQVEEGNFENRIISEKAHFLKYFRA